MAADNWCIDMITNASKGLLAGYSLEALEQRTVTPPYRDYWDQLIRRWREVAAWEAATGRMVNIGSCAGGQVTWLVREAALEYRLTGSPDALEYVGKQIDKLADIFLYHPEKWGRREHPYWSEMHVCLAADLCRGGLDERRLADLRRMVREHFLEAPFIGWDAPYRYLSGHNMTVTEQACAGICALVWGEEAGREDWEAVVRRAIDSCVLYCRNGIDGGGYGYEGTMYATIPMDVTYLFAQLLYQRGRVNLFAEVPALEAYPRALRSLLFPDRTGLAPLADGGILNPKSYAFLLLTAQHYDRPEDLGLWYEYRGPGRAADPWPNNNPRVLWPATGETGPVRADAWGHFLYPFLWWDAGAPMTPVEQSTQPTTNYSPGAEVATFRTGWSRDAVYLNLSGQGRGHAALDHAHADGGHVTLFAHGEYLGIDPGYWNILEEQHSVVLIDGQGQFNRSGDERFRRHYAGRLTGFQRHEILDYALADQAHPRNCVWADRHVLFVRLGGDEAYIMLLDNINPDHGAHGFLWQLQAHPESAVRVTGERTAVVEKPNARLDITFLSPLPADFPGCPHDLTLGTDFVYGAFVGPEGVPPNDQPVFQRGYAYTREEARAMKADLTYSNWYRPRLTAEQHGPNCQLLTILSPRRAGTAPLTVKDMTARRVFRAEIDAGDFTDTIIAAPDHGLVKFPDIEGYTEMALIRRDRNGKVLSRWTLGEKDTLLLR